jgi:hypothetical protein
MPTEPALRADIYCSARLAKYVYRREEDRLPEGWSPLAPVPRELLAMMPPSFEDRLQNPRGTIADASTGLTATLFVNRSTREVVLAFGGTFSGDVSGNSAQLAMGNLGTAARQGYANLKAGLGGRPRIYEQAREVVQTLSRHIEPGFTLRLVGHSLGGGLATYAALAQQTPLRADVFSTSHLHLGLIKQLPEENVTQAPDLVRSYSVSTDLVPHLRKVPLIGIHGLGTEYFYPPDARHGAWPGGAHVNFVEHLGEFFNMGPTASS